ncbi:MAG TPA: SDR family oxidoreductase [Bryobacteraceae bacterium]|nr:SDR family oxidoreductase [Bryobacteraceae bacterium]
MASSGILLQWYGMDKSTHNAIRGKAALVTGGTRGIGRAIAERLLEDGARVAICGRHQETVDGAVQALCAKGDIFGMVTDVSKRDEVVALVAAVREKFREINILVNCAGAGVFASVANLEPAEWDRMIALNLSAAYYCCHEVLPIFQTCGGGDVINISSLAGSNAFAGGAGYNASKFGLNGFSEAMMHDHRNDGVRVSIVAPGSVDTEFGGRTPAGESGDFGGRIAPQDIAQVVVTLLNMPRRTTVSRVEIRPSRPPRR